MFFVDVKGLELREWAAESLIKQSDGKCQALLEKKEPPPVLVTSIEGVIFMREKNYHFLHFKENMS